MTHHEQVKTETDLDLIKLDVQFIASLGEHHKKYFDLIAHHVQEKHGLAPEDEDVYLREIAAHAAAVVRLPTEYTNDDQVLPGILGLPPLFGSNNLPATTSEE
ncbi:MAG TPA: hypothetical protein VMR81_04520 [Patescibacteria group bacterium]|nr:hypothetical protein [Patescibacteria group bacterium]